MRARTTTHLEARTSGSSAACSVNEAEAAIVREAFEKMIELRSVREIARYLNAKGYRQKRYESRRQGDKGERVFSNAVAEIMLKNRLYLGEVPHCGNWHPGQHKPIVDATTFDRVQNIREDNRRGAKAPRENKPHEYLLTGLARCPACDSALTSATTTNKAGTRYFYYRCVSTSKEATSTCPIGQLPAGPLEEAVLAVVRRAASDPVLVERAINESNRIAKDLLEPARERLKTLQAEFASNKTERHRLLDTLLALHDVGSETARERMAALEARGRSLQQAIADEEGKLGVDETRSLSLAAIYAVLRDFDQLYPHFTPGERRELLHEIVDEVRVYPDRVEVALYDGTHASAPMEQAVRKVRGPGGGGGGKPAKANGMSAKGAEVHAVHGEVHAPDTEREPSPGTMKARAATVKLAQRVEWLRIIARSRTSAASDAGLTVRFRRVTRSTRTSSSKQNKGETRRVVVGVLRQAREMQARLREPGVGNRAGLARTLGVSRAHISQSMAVLDAPDRLMDALTRAEETGRPVTLAAWRKVKSLPADAAIGKLREMGYR